jgi:hypothetical protein
MIILPLVFVIILPLQLHLSMPLPTSTKFRSASGDEELEFGLQIYSTDSRVKLIKRELHVTEV